MLWYLTELIPSLIINYILWKSYREKRGIIKTDKKEKNQKEDSLNVIKSANHSDHVNFHLASTDHTDKDKKAKIMIKDFIKFFLINHPKK